MMVFGSSYNKIGCWTQFEYYVFLYKFIDLVLVVIQHVANPVWSKINYFIKFFYCHFRGFWCVQSDFETSAFCCLKNVFIILKLSMAYVARKIKSNDILFPVINFLDSLEKSFIQFGCHWPIDRHYISHGYLIFVLSYFVN